MMQSEFDVIIIGGGSTGLGIAVEAISRGYSVLLLEASDYGKGTSSKSTKLVHGGIRYLANLDFALVKEGLEERYYFLKNAPHLAHKQSYLIPLHNLFEKLQYFVGIHLYDFLAGKLKLGQSRFLSKADTLREAPHLQAEHLSGGAIYYDGQFDDTRMLMTLLSTFTESGGVALNYHKVTQLIKNNSGKLCGVEVNDEFNNIKHTFNAKVIINATGTFTDSVLNLDEPNKLHRVVAAAQGTHLVFDRDIFDSKHALVIPKTIDGRILFVLPWHNKIIVGTTDIGVDTPSLDPQAQDSEIDFILDTLNQYTTKLVTRSDIKSVFAGQRPLVKPNKGHKSSAKISRKHEVIISDSGLISCVGGKWTIYRRMGEDAINFAVKHGLLKSSVSVTRDLKLFGADVNNPVVDYPLSVYGSSAKIITNIQHELNNFDKIHDELPYYQAEVIYHLRYEQAKCVEDILARRTRALFLDAKLAIEAAPLVAELMAKELNKNSAWVSQQLTEFNFIAKQYLVL